MKRTTRLTRESSNAVSYIFSNWKLLLLLLLFTAGVMSGAVTIKSMSNDTVNNFKDIFYNYITARSTQSVIKTFGTSFLMSFAYALCAFAAGLCAVGLPIIVTIPFFNGLGLGMLCGYLYGSAGLKGIGYCLLMIIPSTFVSSSAIILCCSEGLKMSFDIFHTIVPSLKHSSQKQNMKMYCTRFCVFLILMLIAAIIDAIFTGAFSRFFTF